MPPVRLLTSRELRPWLSTHYNITRRFASTSPPITEVSPPINEVHGSRTVPPGRKKNRRRLLWASTSLALGVMGGSLISHTIAPPPLPAPGTQEDAVLMRDLEKRVDEEFKVKVLRGKCLGVAKQLKGEDGGWIELRRGSTGEAAGRGDHMVVNAMAGARGLGVERSFWNKNDKQLVAVIWFGGSLSGWPGVTHGGAIATMLEEKMGEAAALGSGLDATLQSVAPSADGHATMQALVDRPDPDQLSLSYVKPTYANAFYVIRAAPAVALDEDPEHIIPSEPKVGHEIEATLETVDGKTCVKAKAKFTIESSAASLLKAPAFTEGTGQGLRQWLWPSRSSV